MPYWKRSIDLLIAVAALPLLGACVLLVAVVHAVGSPGPVFFTQERVGHRGRRFRICKFRTMRAGADTLVHQEYFRALIRSNAPMEKLDAAGDRRLIPGGWFIRAIGLDELPQLINVLRGDMSLVGPRPCLPSEYADYLPEQRQRLDARPGLTGLWQVSGKNRVGFEDMVRLDIEYARTCSPWLDFKIICLTPSALVVQIIDTRRARRAPRPAVPAPVRRRELLSPSTRSYIP